MRDFPGTVSRIETLTPTIKGSSSTRRAIHFQAGQYVNVQPSQPRHQPCLLARQPAVHRAARSSSTSASSRRRGTTYLHEQLKVGDRITISGPYGRFFVRKSAQLGVIFMAGGSGPVEPARSMILDLLESRHAAADHPGLWPAHPRELYYHDEFLALARSTPTSPTSGAVGREPAGFRLDGLPRLRP